MWPIKLVLRLLAIKEEHKAQLDAELTFLIEVVQTGKI
jgi:hypothetical protein